MKKIIYLVLLLFSNIIIAQHFIKIGESEKAFGVLMKNGKLLMDNKVVLDSLITGYVTANTAGEMIRYYSDSIDVYKPSPLKKKIVVGLNSPHGQIHYLIDVKTKTSTPIYYGKYTFIDRIQWSPNDKYVVFHQDYGSINLAIANTMTNKTSYIINSQQGSNNKYYNYNFKICTVSWNCDTNDCSSFNIEADLQINHEDEYYYDTILKGEKLTFKTSIDDNHQISIDFDKVPNSKF